MEINSSLLICRADYGNAQHAAALVLLLDAYAQDRMGGAKPLSDFSRNNLVRELAARPQAFSILAFDVAQQGELPLSPVGLVNCMEGFSTFACRALVNVHDLVVLPSHRGQGVAEQMLSLVEKIARERGACKLTLEVLDGNASAIRLYRRIGFAAYALEPELGTAQFFQKWLDQPEPQAAAQP